MASIYRKKTERFSEGYRPYFPLEPMQNYSLIQEESQNISRGLYYETSLGKTIIDSLTRYVIGSGLTPMCAPEISLLGWDSERTKKFQKQVEAFYRIITTDTNFDYYGKNPFKDLQKIAFKTIMVTGDVLLHRGYRTLKNGSVVPFIQLISGSHVMNPNGRDDTKNLQGGVLINSDTGHEIGYHVLITDESLNNTYATKLVYKRNYKLGFDEFSLILLQSTDPSQVRGIPLLTPVRDDLLQINKLKDNYMTRTAVQNLFAAAIEKSEETDPGAASVKEKLLETITDQTQEEVVTQGEGLKLDPGIVIELEKGEKIVSIQPSMQAEDFVSGLKSLTGVISSTFGIPYEVLMSSYNASFSASRASINGAEKNFATMRDEFNSKFNNLVYELVLDYGIRCGAIDCPEYLEGGIKRKAVLSCTWVGVTPLQVDPVKEVKAYVEAINNGLCTHEVASRNLYGMDFEEVSERLNDENATLNTNNVSNTGEEDIEEDEE